MRKKGDEVQKYAEKEQIMLVTLEDLYKGE